MASPERQLEEELLEQLRNLKYEHRTDIRDRETLERNFRDKFQTLNHVKLTNGEFQRLLDEIITPDVFTAAHTLRNRNAFTRDDGTPLNFTLVNIADWCKNTFRPQRPRPPDPRRVQTVTGSLCTLDADRLLCKTKQPASRLPIGPGVAPLKFLPAPGTLNDKTLYSGSTDVPV